MTAKKKEQQKPSKSNLSGISGAVNFSNEVVTKIAHIAVDEIDGVHSVGRPRFFGNSSSSTGGIKTEFGHLHAAFDVEVVVEYGRDIRLLAQQLRERIAVEVLKMADREVIEININVTGIHLPGDVVERESNPRVV